jgi:hypothetical protein
MSPFSSNPIASGDQLSIDDKAAPNTRPEDDCKCHRCALSRTIGGFGQRKAIGIVFNANRTPQQSLKIRLQWLTIETGGISIADTSRLNRQGAWNTQTDRRATGQIGFRRSDQADDRLKGRGVVPLRRCDPTPEPLLFR